MAPPSTLYDADIAALGTLHSLVEVFRAFDSDGDGLVSVEELSGIIASLDHIPGDRAALEMTRQGDTDGDGMLSLRSFWRWWPRVCTWSGSPTFCGPHSRLWRVRKR
ncbi:hypothetical protein HPP92_012483 [Vanilla planifolia]|uniref:EF-hand domain-containing protein n=1 Tax=Vanilla planifolia TaxID=51239 RepID=A0A835QXL6_VANPL|nr:hypothetical protein HPP92_012483 [Vanilla planifolia]